MKIAIFGSRRQHQALTAIESFLAEAHRRDIEILMHAKLYRHLHELVPEALDGVHMATGATVDADLAVSLGGDGTFLRTALWTGSGHIPIVGVNTGHLGYLAALAVEQLPMLFDYIENNRFRIERRELLQVIAPELPENIGMYALNEVALMKEETASMINAHVELNGDFLADYRADGLIVSTATGSTAYNISVGGPIVQPTVDVWVLSPVAAHSLSMRPMVVDSSSEIRIVTEGRTPHLRLALDGRSILIANGTEVLLRRAPFTLPLMQLEEHSFADTLRQKLHWGEQ